MIRLALATRAQIAIAPLQDYLVLGSDARMNVPGSTDANWRWRVTSEQLSPAFLDSVRQLVDESNRLAPA
jgi:4-alpha-glucanotransferase